MTLIEQKIDEASIDFNELLKKFFGQLFRIQSLSSAQIILICNLLHSFNFYIHFFQSMGSRKTTISVRCGGVFQANHKSDASNCRFNSVRVAESQINLQKIVQINAKKKFIEMNLSFFKCLRCPKCSLPHFLIRALLFYL